VTEGEFKTLALWRLANHESIAPRFLPIGLGGVWNWRGTVGKTTGPNGDRRDVKGVIPDLDIVVWEGRRVIIAFDADAEKNEQVEVARSLLARELRTRGAEVALITWDIAQGKGIDDLLAKVGPEKVWELVEAADFEKPADDDEISVYQIAELISGRHRFTQDVGGRLYIFRGGNYHSDGAPFVRQQVKQLLERMRLSSKWSSHKAEEVVKYIEVDAPRLWERPKVDVVNVLNGLLDVNTRALSPHSPDFLSPVQLPVTFDPNAPVSNVGQVHRRGIPRRFGGHRVGDPGLAGDAGYVDSEGGLADRRRRERKIHLPARRAGVHWPAECGGHQSSSAGERPVLGRAPCR